MESIPENLTFSPGSPSHPSIFDGWMELIRSANKSINIASFYWTMRGKDIGVDDPSVWQVSVKKSISNLIWSFGCESLKAISGLEWLHFGPNNSELMFTRVKLENCQKAV